MLANGFEEIEVSTVFDVLRRAGLNIFTLGLSNEPVVGSRGLIILPDKSIHSLDTNNLDALIIPGGYPGYVNLANDPSVIQVIKYIYSSDKYLAAICAGPVVLDKAGVITGKRIACYPGVETSLKSALVCKERVVVDGNIITSRGPGTAMDFALKLVETWVDADQAKQLKHDLLY